MDDDRIAELLGGLVASQATLTEQIKEMRADTKRMASSCQSFEEYRAARAHIPIEINNLKIVAEDYKGLKPVLEKYMAKTDFMFQRFMAALALAAVLVLIANALAWLFTKGILAVKI